MSKRPSLEEMFPAGLPDGAKILAMAMPGEAPAAPEPARRSKYGAKPTTYNGVRYASKAEAAYAAKLDDQAARGVVAWWIGQPVFRLGCPENRYQPDFLVVCPAGEVVAVEVKGVETAKFRRDKKLWAAYGPCVLRVVYRDREEVIPGAGGERGGRP